MNAPPPDASQAVERIADRLRSDAPGLTHLNIAAASVTAHESSGALPSVVVQQTLRPRTRTGAANGVEVDVLAEVSRTASTGAYNARRYLTAIHRWAYARLTGTNVDPEDIPLLYAEQLLPVVSYSAPDAAQPDAERGSLFSVASFIITLSPR